MALFSADAQKAFIGVTLIILAVIFLLSGLNVLRSEVLQNGEYIVSQEADVLISFVLTAIGLAYIYSEVGKPGKPKFEVTLGEQTLEHPSQKPK